MELDNSILEQKLGLPKVGQLGFIVHDIRDSLPAYKSLYNIKTWFEPLYAEKKFKIGGEERELEFNIAFGYSGNLQVEIFEEKSRQAAVYKEHLDAYGPGLHHLGVYVSDLEVPDICPDCGETLFNMSRAEYEQLPKDTEFIKSSYTNSAGESVFASVVLSGTARDSIHRPQRCLKGQGNLLDGEYTLEVPMEGREPLMVRIIKMHRTYRTEEGSATRHSYYAYWFVGQDRETPYHLGRMFWLAWDRVVRSTANRWAYIAVSGEREEEGTAYEADIIDFVQHVYPHLLTESMSRKIYDN